MRGLENRGADCSPSAIANCAGTVQLVLDHKSIRTTEEHYAPYVQEYQEMIDAATDAVAERLIA